VSIISKYPVVVKASRRHGVGIAICKNKSDLKKNYIEMSSKFGRCFVQEYIPNGGEYGVYTIFNFNSEPIALTVHKRIRTLYSYGGVSTFRETLKNEKLVKIAFKLLKKIKWSGAAMVEFRIDNRNKLPKLIEINPRFWGSLQLSILAGIDFPYTLYKLILNKDIEPKLNFKEGVKCRWAIGDICGFFNSQNKLNFFIDFLKPNINYDILSLRDPAPFFNSVISQLKNSGDTEQRDENPIIRKSELI